MYDPPSPSCYQRCLGDCKGDAFDVIITEKEGGGGGNELGGGGGVGLRGAVYCDDDNRFIVTCSGMPSQGENKSSGKL